MKNIKVCLCAFGVAAVMVVAQAAPPQTQPAVGGPATASAPSPATSAAGKTTVLFAAAEGGPKRAHMQPVADPFGGTGVVACATRGSHQEQQLVFNSAEFFTIPADRTGQAIVFRMGVNGPCPVRIVISTKDKSVSQTVTLPAEGKWCDMEVPLSAIGDRLGTGEKVVDITLFQKDPAGTGKLFLKTISLVTKAK